MSKTIRLARYRWDKQRPAQIRQLLFRLLPLLLIIFSSALLVWIYRYSDIRQNLDENAFEGASTRTVEAVDDYFSPLIELISSSVLWGSITEIDSIGDPEEYIALLQANLRSTGSVSSFSMTDPQQNELVTTDPHDTSHWFVTEAGSEASLTYKREEAGIRYLLQSNTSAESLPDLSAESGLRISSEYTLPETDMQGITLTLQPSSQYGDRELSLSIDLPFSLMAERLKDGGAVKGTLIFLLMPSGEEYLFLPLDDLLEMSVSDADELRPETPLDGDAQELISLLKENISEAGEENLRLRFDTGGKTWLTEFHQMGVGTDTLTIGTLVPTESLWTFRYSIPLQIILLSILGAAGFLGYRLVLDFFEVSRSPDRIEEMLLEEIGQGESSSLEFKSSLRWDYREERFNKDLEDVIVKSVAAFNNARGGTLLIGVDDHGDILGIGKDYAVLKQPGKDYYEIHLRNLLGARYGAGYTAKSITIDFPAVNGQEICRIRIRRGSQPLYTTTRSKNGGPPVEKFYIRSGNTSQVLVHPSEITSYVLTRFSRRRLDKSRNDS